MDSTNPYAVPESPLLQGDPNHRPERSVVGWCLRYKLVGAIIGLILPLFVFPSTIPPVVIMPVVGAVIGSLIGCVGGVLERWSGRGSRTRKRFE